MKKTMMSNLPRDLSEEVLSRIPLTSLRKVQSTCKKWNTLSKSSFFIQKQHLGQEAKEELMVVLMDYSVYLMGFNLSDKESCIKRQGKLICPEIEVSRVFHCDGLLLCVSSDHKRLVVWNPYCGKPLWIEPTTHRRQYYLYALGYDKSKNSHKILRFRGSYKSDVSQDFTIYDLNSDSDSVSERVLDITPDRMEYNDHSSVTLNGNAYWHATKVDYSGNLDQNFLVCFDFTRETFGPRLPLPFKRVFVEIDTVGLSVVRGREKLAVLFQPFDNLNVEIWVTSKIEPDAITWESKVFLKVSFHQTFHCFIRGGSFFIDEEKKVAIIIDKEFDPAVQPTRHQAYIIGVDASFKKVDLGESSHKHNIPLACSYLPSLIQPN